MQRQGLARVVVAAVTVASVFAFAAPASAVTKAQEAEALDVFKAAAKHYKAGEFAQSDKLFREAFAIHGRPVYLYNAARSAHRRGDLHTAARDYKRVLDLPRTSKKVAERTQKLLDEVNAAQKREAAKAEQEAEKERLRLAKKAKEDDVAFRSKAAWASTITGVVAVGVGGYLLAAKASEQADLDDKVGKKAGGKVIGIDAQTYTAEQDRLDRNGVIGMATIGVGVAAAGLGAYLLMTQPADKVAISPFFNGHGAVVTLRF